MDIGKKQSGEHSNNIITANKGERLELSSPHRGHEHPGLLQRLSGVSPVGGTALLAMAAITYNPNPQEAEAERPGPWSQPE